MISRGNSLNINEPILDHECLLERNLVGGDAAWTASNDGMSLSPEECFILRHT